MEEFIEKKHKYLIGGDIFIKNGKVILWGLLNCHRDNCVNPLVPVGKSYPLCLEKEDIEKVKNVLQSLVECLNIRFGAMNVELIIDQQDRVWLIDVGPRAGGNMIPDLLGLIFNVDVVKMNIMAAMGELEEVKIYDGQYFFATHNLHSSKNGIYCGIKFLPELEKYIIKKCIYKRKGDKIRYFSNAADALGILFMRFNNMDEMLFILEHINNYIYIDMDVL